VAAVEAETPDEGVPFDVDGTPVGLVARIDRIDHHPERGEWAVFDYKTGETGKTPEQVHLRNRGREWADLQLPLYHWLAPRLRDAEGAPLVAPAVDGRAPRVEVGYILLPRELGAVGASMAAWGPDRLEEALERAREVVRAMRTGPAAFDPERRPVWPDDAMEALVGRSVLAADGDEGET
jgi:RecB family exonuclease